MSKTIRQYTFFGILFGLCFPIGAYLLEYLIKGYTHFSIVTLHKHNSLLYMIDSAPIFLGFFAAIGGYFRGKANQLIHDLQVKTDETTQALTESDHMKKQLSLIVEDVQEIAPYLQKNVHALDQNLLAILEHLDSTALLAVSSIENIAKTLKGVSQDALGSSHKLDYSITSLENYGEKFDYYSKGMLRIEQQIKDSNDRLLGLMEESRHINQIMDILRDIASNTKLIGFNASIEAAKLDNESSTFMVIASEINKLSNASQRAIDDIGPILHAINSEIAVIGEDFQDTSTKILEGTSILSDFNGMIGHLAHDISQLKTAMEDTTQTLMTQSDNVTSISQQTKSFSRLQNHIKEAIALSKEPMEDSLHMINDIIAKIS